MKWTLTPWHRSQSQRPRTRTNIHLFEALENRAVMAGDLHAVLAPPAMHREAPVAQVLQQVSSPTGGHIFHTGTSGSTATVAPGVPTGVIATAGDGAVKLTWTAPASTVDTGRVGYVVQYSTDAGATWTVVNHRFGETHAVIPLLTNGTSYVFEVAAVNRAGRSAFSDMSAAVTPVAATAPGVPTAVTAEAYNGAVKLSWTAPASTVDTGRVGYVVQYSTDAGATWTTVNRRFGETHAIIPRLTNGTSYVFEVAAVNRVGQSAFSDMSAAVTPVASGTTTTPAKPRGNASR